MGRAKEAKEDFQRVLSRKDIPPAVRKNIEAFIEKIDTRKRWGGVVSVGYLFDSNVNSAPSDPNIQAFGLPFTLDDNSTGKSGQAFVSSASLIYNFDAPLADEWSSNVYTNILEYAGHSAYDTDTVGVSVGPNYYRWANFSFPVGYERQLTSHMTSAKSWSFTPSVSKKIGVHTILNLRASWEKTTDQTATGSSNGISRSTGVNIKYKIGNLGQLELGASYINNDADDYKYNRSISRGVSAGFYATLPFADLNLAVQPSASQVHYKEIDPVDNGRRRFDNVYVVNVNVSKSVNVFGQDIIPVFGITYTNNSSNINRRDYQRTQVTFQIRKRF